MSKHSFSKIYSKATRQNNLFSEETFLKVYNSNINYVMRNQIIGEVLDNLAFCRSSNVVIKLSTEERPEKDGTPCRNTKK